MFFETCRRKICPGNRQDWRRPRKTRKYCNASPSNPALLVVMLDSDSREVLSSNNNSICAILYPSQIRPRCTEFCVAAFAKASEAGGPIEYKCHAGLDCKAVLLQKGDNQIVAITGRVFTKAEDYRVATERSIAGDWQQYPPSEFFGNVLLGGSDRKISGAVRASKACPIRKRIRYLPPQGLRGRTGGHDSFRTA